MKVGLVSSDNRDYPDGSRPLECESGRWVTISLWLDAVAPPDPAAKACLITCLMPHV